MHHRTLIAIAVVTLAACPASKTTRPDPKPVEETDAGFRLRGEGRSIPALAPLALLEEAPAVQMGDAGEHHTSTFTIGDLKVIHRRTPANVVVQARVYVRGGVANLTAETAGIEQLAMTVAANGGTEQTPKDEMNAALDATGAEIFSFNDRDASGYGLKTITEHFDKNWEIFTQAVLSPAMPEDDIEVRRTRQLANIASLLEDPNAHVGHVAREYMYENHAYAQLHVGTKENVESFTRDELLAYQRAMLVPANMLVVVVGDLDTKALAEKVRASFGRLQPKKVAPIDLSELTSAPGVKFAQRTEFETNYIIGLSEAPPPGHADFVPLQVASAYLSERLFEEVRSKRGLTYAVSAGVSDRRTNYAFLYVTAEDPVATLPVMFEEVRKLRETPLDDDSVRGTLNVFITEHYMGLQTNGAQASSLAQAELTGGDWRLEAKTLEQARAVTPEDMQRVAKKYLHGYRFALVGPKTDLDPALFAGPAQ